MGVTMDKLHTCMTCCFFRRFPTPAHVTNPYVAGQCRIRAPFVDLKSADGPRTMWPRVRGDDFCGEHAEIDG